MMSMSVSVSVSTSMSISVSVYMYMSISMSVSVCKSVSIPVSMSVSVSMPTSVSVSMCLCLYLCLFVFVSISVSVSIYWFGVFIPFSFQTPTSPSSLWVAVHCQSSTSHIAAIATRISPTILQTPGHKLVPVSTMESKETSILITWLMKKSRLWEMRHWWSHLTCAAATSWSNILIYSWNLKWYRKQLEMIEENTVEQERRQWPH